MSVLEGKITQCVQWHIYIYKLIKGHGPERRSVHVAGGGGAGGVAPTHINDGESFDREQLQQGEQ